MCNIFLHNVIRGPAHMAFEFIILELMGTTSSKWGHFGYEIIGSLDGNITNEMDIDPQNISYSNTVLSQHRSY